jgi:hypothetical protein
MKFLLIVILIILYPVYIASGEEYKIKKSVVGSSSQIANSVDFVAHGTVGQAILGHDAKTRS